MPDTSDPRAEPAPLTMDEILDALDMPRSGLRAWFGQLQDFCRKHGGPRYYRDLIELIDECQAALDQEDDRAHRRSEDAHR